MQGDDKWTRKRTETKNGKGNGKGKPTEEGKGTGKGNGKEKGIVKQIPGGDVISHAVAVQMQKEMYEADSDTDGLLEQVYLEPEALPAVSISLDDDTDSTEKSDSEYDSEDDSDVDMRLEDDGDALDGVDLDSYVDMETEGGNDGEEDEEEEDEEKED